LYGFCGNELAVSVKTNGRFFANMLSFSIVVTVVSLGHAWLKVIRLLLAHHPPQSLEGASSKRSARVVMHAALMQNGRVMFLDKVEDYTQLAFEDGHLAYSSEYDPETNEVVPLRYEVRHHF
jgi:phage portal protein BeeE